MSVSTDAILFYGYCSDDEEWPEDWGPDPSRQRIEASDDANTDEDESDFDEDEDADTLDWEEVYASRKGVEGLFEPFDDARFGTDTAYAKSWKKRWDAKRRAVENAKVVLDTHCSGECPMYYIAVTESRISASRGTPEEISPTHMEMKTEAWHEQLDDFCKTMGFSLRAKKDKPRWWLVSYWG